MRVVKLFEQNYVVGLWWQIRPGGPAAKKALLLLARATATEFKAEGYNQVALRNQQYGQYGLGKSDKSTKSSTKLHSLAAALRPLGGHDTFLGVFCLEESPQQSLWWVCAISKGIIAAEGDACFASEEEAQKAAQSLRQLFAKGEEAYCPTPEESLQFLKPLLHHEEPLEDLFPDPGQHKRRLAKLAGLLLGLGCLAGGVWLYDYFQEQDTLAFKLSQENAEARYKKELQEHPENFFTMGWLNQPSVQAMGAQCALAMLRQALVVQGWTLDEMTCSSGGLNVARLHTTGASFTVLPAKSRLASAQKTITSLALPPLPKRPLLAHTLLPEKDRVASILYQITQDLGANLQNLTWEPPEQLMQNDVRLIAPWQKGKFELSAVPGQAVMDLELFQALEYPGLVITAVSWVKNVWKIQGVSYVRAK